MNEYTKEKAAISTAATQKYNEMKEYFDAFVIVEKIHNGELRVIEFFFYIFISSV